MDDSRIEEILHRLDAIERYLHEHAREHEEREYGWDGRRGPRDRDHHEPRCRCHESRNRCGCHDRGPGGCHGHGHGHGPQGGNFDEKRVVDLIVRLVGERVDELLWRHGRAIPPGSPPPVERAGDVEKASSKD